MTQTLANGQRYLPISKHTTKRSRVDPKVNTIVHDRELENIVNNFESLADKVESITDQFKQFASTQSRIVKQQQETNISLFQEMKTLKSSLESIQLAIDKFISLQSTTSSNSGNLKPPVIQPPPLPISSNFKQAIVPQSKHNPWEVVNNKKRSFRDVVLSHPLDKQHAVASLLKLSNRFQTFHEPSKPKTDAEKESKVRLVYVRGISRMKLSELRKLLMEAGIYMKPILNIRFIGRSITEFMISEEFENQFKRKISSFGNFITVIEDFDPRAAKNVNDRELMDHARNRFVESCSRVINSENASPKVKEFYKSFVESNDQVKKAYSKLRKQKDNLIAPDAQSQPEVPPNEQLRAPNNFTQVSTSNNLPHISSSTDQDGDCDMVATSSTSRPDPIHQ